MAYNALAQVTSHVDLGSGIFEIRLAAPEIALEARAGQFVMVGLPDIDAMLIRRPFSVARVWPEPEAGPPQAFDILFKVYGRRTLALSQLRPGASLSILGPLGRGFWLPDEAEDVDLILVAGGIGNAIFPLLLQQLGPRARRTTLFFGGRSRADLTLLDWFEARCGRVVPVTEDGSLGQKGLVTEPLLAALETNPGKRRVVMTCGPTPMMKAVAQICLERDVPCQLSLEETMACGFGVCLGCVCERREAASDFERFARVCSEGPVFDAREVRL